MPLGGRKGTNVGPLLCLACPGLTNTAKGSGKVIAGRTALEPRGPGGDRVRARSQTGSDIGLEAAHGWQGPFALPSREALCLLGLRTGRLGRQQSGETTCFGQKRRWEMARPQAGLSRLGA